MAIWKPKIMDMEGPLYVRIADSMERDIHAGRLRPGQRLPAQRDLADALGINVSTVTRGYGEAERRGLTAGTVGRGTFVASDAATAPFMSSEGPHAPGMLEMGLCSPLYDCDPDIAKAMIRLGKNKDLNGFTRYTDPAGFRHHREAGALWAAQYGLKASPENIVVCAGSQHALTCVFGALFTRGERIAADDLTYPGIKALTSMFGLRPVPVAMDKDGMIPESLDMACRRDEIRGLYLMPDFHNPTTICMPEKRRDALAEVALRHDLLLIEDDAYALTCEQQKTPVTERIPKNSIHFSGVSKVLWAGLRVTFVTAPGKLRRRIVDAVLSTMWVPPSLNAELIAAAITDGTAKRILQTKRNEAAKRMAVAREVLTSATLHGQPSGYFAWLELPAPWTGASFETRARELGVNLFGAERFAVGGSNVPAAARLSLTGSATRRELRNGLKKINDLLDGEYSEIVPTL